MILKPNLNTQMKKQEKVDKEKRSIERKLTNTQRLKDLKSGKQVTTITNQNSSTRITLRDKVQAGTAITQTKTTTSQKTLPLLTP